MPALLTAMRSGASSSAATISATTISATTASAESVRRSWTSTEAPFAASSRATARPMPDPAPLTIADRLPTS